MGMKGWKLAVWILIAWNGLGAEAIEKRYATDADCVACHTEISKKWETSRHAHSHFTKNDLYDRTLDHMAGEEVLKTREELVVECAKCHNPRIEKRKVEDVDKLSLLLDIDTKTMNRMIDNATMRNGINCIVCHNVDEIHLKKGDPSVRGFDAVKFGPQGTMFGPFDGAKSPYHLTRKRDFFVKDPAKLCFVCHYNDQNSHGIEIYSTGREYEEAKAPDGEKPQCIECHMSGKKSGVASNYKGEGGMVRRMVRDHLFASIDNSDIYKKYIETDAELKEGKLRVTVRNLSPHKLPTGYGLRRLELQVRFYGEKDRKLGETVKLFTAVWKNGRGEETIPHLAVKRAKDTRIPPYGEVTESFELPEGTKLVNYRLVYRQIGKKMADKLGVKDPFFTREYVLKNGVIEP
jgi:hypothetical protein